MFPAAYWYFYIEIIPAGPAVRAANSWFDVVDAGPSFMIHYDYMDLYKGYTTLLFTVCEYYYSISFSIILLL